MPATPLPAATTYSTRSFGANHLLGHLFGSLFLVFLLGVVAVHGEDCSKRQDDEYSDDTVKIAAPTEATGERPVPQTMGVTEKHLGYLQKFCDETNVVLMLRLSDPTTVALIETGNFASKGQNIHDKSSNWGPQQGCVPVDPYFNKKFGKALPNDLKELSWNTDLAQCQRMKFNTPKCSKVPQWNIREDRRGTIDEDIRKDSGMEEFRTGLQVIQHFLTGELYREYTKDKRSPRQSTVNTKRLKKCHWKVCRAAGEDRGKCTKKGDCLCVQDRRATLPEDVREQTFCLEAISDDFAENDDAKALVWWVRREETAESRTIPKLQELWVWAYENGGINAQADSGISQTADHTTHSPVTGDYDLWMVAPHVNTKMASTLKPRKRLPFMGKLKTSSTRGHKEGGSLMTELVHSLLGYGADEYNLNKRLGRAQGKEVFHHGAEVDNYFFLQELDKKIAVIIPSNRNLPPFLKTGAVETKEGHLPRVLASLQAHGYLIVDNPMMATMPADIGHRFSGKKSVQQTDKDEAEKMDAFMNCVIRMRGVYQWPRSVSSDWVDAGSEESCVESHRESCRRVSPSIKALTSATRPYKLDEKHYSKLVLLGRSLAAQRERLLMSHYFRKDEKDVAGQDSAVGHFLPREKATRLKSLNKQITKSFCKDTSNCVDKIKECLDTLETTGASLPSGCTPIMKRRLWLVKRATTSAMAAFTWSQAHKTRQAFNEIITFVEKALAKKALAKKALAEQGMALLRGRMEMGSPP